MKEIQAEADHDQRLDEAIAVYYQWIEAGQVPAWGEFLALYPDLADGLTSFMRAKKAFEKGAEPLLPGEGTGLAVLEEPVGVKVRYLGDYELLEEFARGGMGIVFKARQLSLERTVALKIIRAGERASEEQVRRFQTEAAAAASLDHPHIVPIYEVGNHEELHYFSMKLIDGPSLSQRLSAGPAEPRDAARLLAVVARAVHHAHQRGVLHRDLKPANVLLDVDGQPHVTDFGLAKRVDPSSEPEVNALTQSHTILGTACYLSPEQAAGRVKDLSTATDVYSLGAVLYETLTGRPPFQGEDLLDTLRQVRDEEPVPPRHVNAAIDRDLQTICLKCLEKAPKKRYSSAQAVADDLERWLRGEPVLARPATTLERGWKWACRRPAVASLLGVIVFVVAIAFGLILAQWQRAEDEHRKAETRANTEADARRTVEKQKAELQQALFAAERNLSYHRIALADRYWVEANVVRAEEYLGTCPVDHRHWEWHYLKRLCHQERLRLPGELHAVFSPDGRLIAAVGLDETIKLWDATTGREIHTVKLQAGEQVSTLAFAPDGKTLAAGLIIKERERPLAQPVKEGGWSILEYDYAHGVRSWDAATGELRTFWPIAIDGKDRHSLWLSFSADGNRLAVATRYHMSDLPTGVWVLDAHTGKVRASIAKAGFEAFFSPNGKYLAYTARVQPSHDKNLVYDNVPAVWDLEQNKELYKLPGDRGDKSRPQAFSPDGKLLYVHRLFRDILVLEAATGREVQRWPASAGFVLAVSPDGKLMATGTNRIQVFDASNGTARFAFAGHSASVTSLAFDRDSKRLLSTATDGTVRVWQVNQGQEGYALPGTPDDALVQALSPDGKLLATKRKGLLGFFSIDITDVATGKVQGHLAIEPFLGSYEDDLVAYSHFLASPMVFSPDGTRLAVAGSGHPVRLWDLATGKRVSACEGHTAQVFDLVFSPDGKRLATVAHDNSVRLWDVDSGRQVRLIKGHDLWTPGRIAFSPDGRSISVTGNGDMSPFRARAGKVVPGETRLIEIDGNGERTMSDEAGTNKGAVFSSDGQRLATWDFNGTVHIWDLAKEKQLFRLPADPEQVEHVAFSPDGKRLASLGWSAIKLWDPETGLEILTLRGLGSTRSNGTKSVFFSRDGHKLYASLHGGLQCWDGTPLPPPPPTPKPAPPPPPGFQPPFTAVPEFPPNLPEVPRLPLDPPEMENNTKLK